MRWRSPFGNCPRDCPINACALSSPLTVPHPWAPPGPLRARREGSPSLPLPARCLPRGARSSAGQSICLLSRWSQVRILPGAPLISAPFCPAAGLVRQDRSPLPAQNRRAPNAKPLCPSIPKLPDPIENSAAFSDHPPTRQACPHGVSETDPPQSMRCRVNEQRLPPLGAFEVRQLDGAFEAQPSSRLRTCSVRGPAPAVLAPSTPRTPDRPGGPTASQSSLQLDNQAPFGHSAPIAFRWWPGPIPTGNPAEGASSKPRAVRRRGSRPSISRNRRGPVDRHPMPSPLNGRVSARPGTHSGGKPPQSMRCRNKEPHPGYTACLNCASLQAALKTDEGRNLLTSTHESRLGRKEPVQQECRHRQAGWSGVPSPLAESLIVPMACLIWASVWIPSDDGDSAAGNFALSVTGGRSRGLLVAADTYAGGVLCHGLCPRA